MGDLYLWRILVRLGLMLETGCDDSWKIVGVVVCNRAKDW